MSAIGEHETALVLVVTVVLQLIVWLVVIVRMASRYGLKIETIEVNMKDQKDSCSERMKDVVTKELLEAKLDILNSEVKNIRYGQAAIEKKVDKIFDLMQNGNGRTKNGVL